MPQKVKSTSFLFYWFWLIQWIPTSNNQTLARCELLCPTFKHHIQFRRHSVVSCLVLSNGEQLLLFGSYFCGSGRPCGRNMQLVDRDGAVPQTGREWPEARPLRSPQIPHPQIWSAASTGKLFMLRKLCCCRIFVQFWYGLNEGICSWLICVCVCVILHD